MKTLATLLIVFDNVVRIQETTQHPLVTILVLLLALLIAVLAAGILLSFFIG